MDAQSQAGNHVIMNTFTLHTIFNAAAVTRAMPWIRTGDTVLFCGTALVHHAVALPTEQRLGLAQDAAQYGITADTLPLISDAEWVQQVLAHSHRVNWA